MKKQGAVRYHMYKFLKTDPSSPDYRGLDRIVELFMGLKDILCYACAMLFQFNRKMEAKGIVVRNGLTPEDFLEAYSMFPKKLNHAHVGKDLMQMKYDAERDYQPKRDLFEPVSQPPEAHLRLPESIKIEVIETEEMVDNLKVLCGKKYVGVDSEWRVQLHRWHDTKGPAILQIADQ